MNEHLTHLGCLAVAGLGDRPYAYCNQAHVDDPLLTTVVQAGWKQR